MKRTCALTVLEVQRILEATAKIRPRRLIVCTESRAALLALMNGVAEQRTLLARMHVWEPLLNELPQLPGGPATSKLPIQRVGH